MMSISDLIKKQRDSVLNVRKSASKSHGWQLFGYLLAAALLILSTIFLVFLLPMTAACMVETIVKNIGLVFHTAIKPAAFWVTTLVMFPMLYLTRGWGFTIVAVVWTFSYIAKWSFA